MKAILVSEGGLGSVEVGDSPPQRLKVPVSPPVVDAEKETGAEKVVYKEFRQVGLVAVTQNVPIYVEEPEKHALVGIPRSFNHDSDKQ